MDHFPHALLGFVALAAVACGDQGSPSAGKGGNSATPQAGTGAGATGGSQGGTGAGATGGVSGSAGSGAGATASGGTAGASSSAGGAGGVGGAGGSSGAGATGGSGAMSGGGGSAPQGGMSGDGGMSPGGTGGAPVVACDASKKPALGALGLSKVFVSDATQLSGVSFAAQPPGSDDWYFVEQKGRILVLAAGALKAAPFFDVTAEIALDAAYDERGLHSIAFPPDYATSGLFYVVLTPTKGDRQYKDLLLEHKRSAADPYVADMTPVRTIMSLDGAPEDGRQFANIHNSYMAKFGPDGMLYMGMGDGGGSCNNNAGFENAPQSIESPNGKLLRFDLSKEAPYGAADNPFAADGDARVLHYGLRNPFRFNWDLETGDLYIGDVGQDTHEELNVVAKDVKGLDFGWASVEGDQTDTCPNHPLRSGATVTPPIFFTTHGGGGGLAPACSTSPFCDYSSIVAGAVYRGSAIPSLQGAFVFGDWAGDNMAALYHCGSETSEVQPIDYTRDANLPEDGYLVKVGDGVPEIKSLTQIVEDHARELHLVVNGNALLKIVAAP